MDLKMPKVVKDLCQPAYVYFVLSAFSTLFYVYSIIDKSRHFNTDELNMNGYTVSGLVSHIVFSVFWIYALNWLCKTSVGKKFAWFFVLLPFLVIALIIIGISGIRYRNSQNNRNLQKITESQKFKESRKA